MLIGHEALGKNQEFQYDLGMKFLSLLILLLSLFSCRSPAPEETSRPKEASQERNLEIYEVGPNRKTALTKQNLYQVIQVYDLAKFLYTHRVKIEENVPTRSHPILTINTDYAEAPNKIMAQWLHQQFHWWANSRPKQVWAAIDELKKLYPNPPIQSQEEKKQYYLHFIINYLEFRAMGMAIGYNRAHKLILEMVKENDHYGVVYKEIFKKPTAVRNILRKHQLIPAAMN